MMKTTTKTTPHLLLLLLLLPFISLLPPVKAQQQQQQRKPQLEQRQEHRRHATLHARVEFERLNRSTSLQEMWFSQNLDHFNREEERTFLQRYFLNTKYFKEGGALFVYIGGEGELSPGCVEAGEIVENAKLHNAALVGLEHRYYGASQPFSTWETENLKWLSSQQGLADLSNFIPWLQRQQGWPSSLTNAGGAQQIITWGGSYPGALSAWFRAKFPHISLGSVASSAPVLAKADFFEYDQSVAAAAGEECVGNIQAATTLIESMLDDEKTREEIKNKFGCSAVSDDNGFLYVLADAVAFAVQYNSDSAGPRYHLKEKLCNNLQASDPVQGYAKFVSNLFDALNTNCVDFTSIDITLNQTEVSVSSGQRQWYYQSCTEFGFFQTAPPSNPVRSRRIDLAYHLDLCKRVFPPFALVPSTNFTNNYYGGNNTIAGSNIIFPNGSIDPWHVLSLQTPLPSHPTEIPLLIEGTSHCADLYADNPSDPPALTQAREKITGVVSSWLK